MRISTLARLPLCVLLCFHVASVMGKDEVRSSAVKVHVTQRPPDFIRPWTKSTARKTSGSGAIIEGKRILTNWHVVEYASQIFVQFDQTSDKTPARVVATAPGMDLALLELEDPAELDSRPFLPIAESLPDVSSTVNVYGYPIGGEDMSVTEGIISRIDFTRYSNDAVGVRIQVDAALNPGNSGGPAVTDGQIVGLVFSKINQAENIGYLIPAEEVRMFLADSADGTYDGKPALYDRFQTAENVSLRAKLGLSEETTGYHAITFGFLAGELVKRVDGRSLGTFFAEEIARPLGADVWIGLPESEDGRVAEILKPRRPPDQPLPSNPVAIAALANPVLDAEVPNERWYRAAEIPAANGQANARGLAQVYGLLANGGELSGVGLISPNTIASATRERLSNDDLVLEIPMRWAAGYALNDGVVYGPGELSFGHSGWGGSFACADPIAGIGIAYAMNQMSSFPRTLQDRSEWAGPGGCRIILPVAGPAEGRVGRPLPRSRADPRGPLPSGCGGCPRHPP